MRPRHLSRWSMAGRYKINQPGAENPRRQGARWTDDESQDVLRALFHGATVAGIARRHQRTESAIGMRLMRLETTVPIPAEGTT